jgi:hypothetical protein
MQRDANGRTLLRGHSLAANRRCQAASAASVLQASRGDVTVFRLNAAGEERSRLEPAFLRNHAACVYTFEAAHYPEVAGSNPAPATSRGPGNGAFRLQGRLFGETPGKIPLRLVESRPLGGGVVNMIYAPAMADG